jgi:two-component system cell cycle response regulator DivK
MLHYWQVRNFVANFLVDFGYYGLLETVPSASSPGRIPADRFAARRGAGRPPPATRAGVSQGRAMAKTVLIVEDNELNMKLFNDLLEAHGFATLQTRDGMEALRMARRHRPDLILMDIQLPEVSGLEVTKWIKEDDQLKMIPIIAVTAFAMKGDEEKIREGGCEAYIAKPISVAHFLETVQRFLN